MKLFTTASALALVATTVAAAGGDSPAPAVALRGAAGRMLVEDTNVLAMMEGMDEEGHWNLRNKKVMIESANSHLCMRLDASDFSGVVMSECDEHDVDQQWIMAWSGNLKLFEGGDMCMTMLLTDGSSERQRTVMKPCMGKNHPNQVWEFDAGLHRIRSKTNTDVVIGGARGAIAEGTIIGTASYTQGQNSQWWQPTLRHYTVFTVDAQPAVMVEDGNHESKE